MFGADKIMLGLSNNFIVSGYSDNLVVKHIIRLSNTVRKSGWLKLLRHNIECQHNNEKILTFGMAHSFDDYPINCAICGGDYVDYQIDECCLCEKCHLVYKNAKYERLSEIDDDIAYKRSGTKNIAREVLSLSTDKITYIWAKVTGKYGYTICDEYTIENIDPNSILSEIDKKRRQDNYINKKACYGYWFYDTIQIYDEITRRVLLPKLVSFGKCDIIADIRQLIIIALIEAY